MSLPRSPAGGVFSRRRKTCTFRCLAPNAWTGHFSAGFCHLCGPRVFRQRVVRIRAGMRVRGAFRCHDDHAAHRLPTAPHHHSREQPPVDVRGRRRPRAVLRPARRRRRDVQGRVPPGRPDGQPRPPAGRGQDGDVSAAAVVRQPPVRPRLQPPPRPHQPPPRTPIPRLRGARPRRRPCRLRLHRDEPRPRGAVRASGGLGFGSYPTHACESPPVRTLRRSTPGHCSRAAARPSRRPWMPAMAAEHGGRPALGAILPQGRT